MKSSFIMYADWLDMVSALDDVGRSELLMAVMLYQNDQDIPDMGMGASVAFAQMKKQFDKDNDKYEETCEKRREAGRLGGKQKVANASKSKQMLANASKCKQMGSKSKQMPPDNDNDNDNVNENDNENENDNKTKRKRKVKEKEPVVYYPNDDKLNQAFSDYVEMRKQIKSPMTDRAITLAMNKLKELAAIPFSDMMDNDLAIEILNQSVMNNWKGLFPLKDNGQSRTQNMAQEVDSWIKQNSGNS